MHSRPSPKYPGIQEQLNDPLVLLHVALIWQLCVPVAHSLISVKKKKKNRQATMKANKNNSYVRII